MIDFLSAMVFDDDEIGIFLNRNCCGFCGSALQKKPTKDRKWNAFCPVCQQDVMQHNTVKKGTMEKVENDRAAARVERAYQRIRETEEKKNPDDILAMLGFGSNKKGKGNDDESTE